MKNNSQRIDCKATKMAFSLSLTGAPCRPARELRAKLLINMLNVPCTWHRARIILAMGRWFFWQTAIARRTSEPVFDLECMLRNRAWQTE